MSEPKVDFLGNEINVGDRVIFEAPKYRDFVIGKVISKAEKTCQIEFLNTLNNSKGFIDVFRQFYGQLIKLPEPKSEEKRIEEIVRVVRKLTFDLRTNMTSVTRYVRHERSKSPTLTEGQFLDRHLKYRELANVAVDNILKCINDNEELRQIESMRFEEGYCKQVEAEWIDRYGGKYANSLYECSHCKRKAPLEVKANELGNAQTVQVLSPFCPNCGAKMKEVTRDG